MPRILITGCNPFWGCYRLVSRAKVIENQFQAFGFGRFSVTYPEDIHAPNEDLSDPVYPEFLPVDDEVFPAEEQPMPAADSPTHQSPGYIPESDPEEDPEEDDEEDPEEDPTDYPADRGDDRDDEEPSDDDDDDAEEEEHLAPADPAAVAYSADQDPYLAYRITARMSIRPHAPATREHSTAGAARQVGPTTARADLYGFADMLDAAPGRQTSRELGYGITDTGILRTALLMEEEAKASRAAWAQSMDALANQETDGDFRSAESRPSETETVSGGTKDSEGPLKTHGRASGDSRDPSKDPCRARATREPVAVLETGL
ncbi:hypothetical protein Tco_0798398 [Tanacetum coccineum]